MHWTNEKLIITNMEVKNAEMAIRTLAGVLLEQGYVRSSFENAILAREEVYPTGLPTSGFHVAIPHTDPEHVIQPAMAFGVLSAPVEFKEMGNPDSVVNIDLICMLAITKADAMVELLGTLVQIFQDSDFMRKVCTSSKPEEIANLINSRLPEMKESG